MRYSLPWHVVEPRAGEFDWSWSDERIGYAKELGLNLILDLVHFGTPTWLPEAFGDVEFPMRWNVTPRLLLNNIATRFILFARSTNR